MGIVDSVRAVMWARKRQPDQVAYGVALGHERFGPRELLDQAVAAERAGFDLVLLQRPPGSLVGTGAGAAGPLCERLGVAGRRRAGHLGGVAGPGPRKRWVGEIGEGLSDRKYKMMAIVSADRALTCAGSRPCRPWGPPRSWS